jgi:hypothetical protein
MRKAVISLGRVSQGKTEKQVFRALQGHKIVAGGNARNALMP